MADYNNDQLQGTWVAVQERSNAEELVFLRPDADLPPTRGGRQNLVLGSGNEMNSMEQGATDKLESKDKGSWFLSGDRLELHASGWEGTYDIDTLTEKELILRRR